MDIGFLLNGEPVRIRPEPPTRTLLDWLRDERGLTGTKEGCNEGDCGACTVMVQDDTGIRALNACILFLPQLDGKAVRTVEGLRDDAGDMHPVQKAMVDHHGAQCGFCTPGFIASNTCAPISLNVSAPPGQWSDRKSASAATSAIDPSCSALPFAALMSSGTSQAS